MFRVLLHKLWIVNESDASRGLATFQVMLMTKQGLILFNVANEERENTRRWRVRLTRTMVRLILSCASELLLKSHDF